MVNADELTASMLDGQAAVMAAMVLTAGLAALSVLVLCVYLHAAVRAS
jgi:hypothetical protein